MRKTVQVSVVGKDVLYTCPLCGERVLEEYGADWIGKGKIILWCHKNTSGIHACCNGQCKVCHDNSECKENFKHSFKGEISTPLSRLAKRFK